MLYGIYIRIGELESVVKLQSKLIEKHVADQNVRTDMLLKGQCELSSAISLQKEQSGWTGRSYYTANTANAVCSEHGRPDRYQRRCHG